MVVLTTSLNLQTTGFRFPFGTQMEYNNLATTPGPGWRTTHGLEPLRFVDGRVYYEEGVNSVKVFLPITGGNYKATYFVQDRLDYYYDLVDQVNYYRIRTANGTIRLYSDSGHLIKLKTPGGTTGSVTYTTNGNLYQEYVKQGLAGSAHKLRELAYGTRTVTNVGTIYVLTSETIYRGDGGTNGVQTTYAYNTWHSGTFQPQQVATTLPTVSTGENGTGNAHTITENFDV
jgi:YD repeat-containing protein